MHSRPMFPILETQVGDGWVGDIDYTKQDTKQDSNFLVDWVRVYQSEGQPVTRFDDLDGAESGVYRIAPASRTEGLTAVSNGDAAWQNKNNFYYGGQPRPFPCRAPDAGPIRPALAGPTNTLPNPDECFYPQRATRCR